MLYSATSSGLKTADAVIYAGPCRLLGVQLIGDGTNASSVILYDHAASASGLEVSKLALPAGTAGAGQCFADCNIPPGGVYCNSGIFADVAGTNAKYIVLFSIG